MYGTSPDGTKKVKYAISEDRIKKANEEFKKAKKHCENERAKEQEQYNKIYGPRNEQKAENKNSPSLSAKDLKEPKPSQEESSIEEAMKWAGDILKSKYHVSKK